MGLPVPTATEPRKMISLDFPGFPWISGVRNGQLWGGPFPRSKMLILEWKFAIENEPF